MFNKYLPTYAQVTQHPSHLRGNGFLDLGSATGQFLSCKILIRLDGGIPSKHVRVCERERGCQPQHSPILPFSVSSRGTELVAPEVSGLLPYIRGISTCLPGPRTFPPGGIFAGVVFHVFLSDPTASVTLHPGNQQGVHMCCSLWHVARRHSRICGSVTQRCCTGRFLPVSGSLA